MPNINHKIKLVGGRSGLHRKLNEIIDVCNWLLGIRTANGIPISESSTGPVIDLLQQTGQQQAQPWTIDPNGKAAGWTLMTYLDASGNLNDVYVWTGVAFNNRVCS